MGATKSGVYVGLKTNDTLTMSFNGCSLPGSSLTLNGQATIVATADNLNLGPNYLAQYRLTTTNFDFVIANSKFRSSGTQVIRYNATAGVSFPDVLSTAASAYIFSYFNQPTATTAAVSLNLNTGAVLSSKTNTSNTFTTSFNGAVQASTPSGTVNTAIATLTPLSGPSTPSAGRTVPTSGVVNVIDSTLNLATSTTVQPVSVFVKFDSNRDSSLDASYTTTYTALTTF